MPNDIYSGNYEFIASLRKSSPNIVMEYLINENCAFTKPDFVPV